MSKNLSIKILVAIIAGSVFGLILGPRASSVKFLGDVFIRLLKMIIVPLILASMITGVMSIGDMRKLGRIGIKTLAYYLATTGLAVFVGLVLVLAIRPGSSFVRDVQSQVHQEVPAVSLADTLINIIPDNPFRSLVEMNVLSIIAFSLLFGITLTRIGEKGNVIRDFFVGLNETMMLITHLIMNLAPFGVFGLMADVIGRMGLSVILPMVKYMTTVTLGLLIHGGIVLPLILYVFSKRNPFVYFKQVSAAVFTAFSTASSAATIPVTMECVEENAGISPETASFVLPLGATINMDGTALLEAVAATFIAQINAIQFSGAQLLIVFLTSTLASIGAAAIPGAGLITIAIVLKAVGLPLEDIGLVLAVDRILDMMRTGVNVWGDSIGCAVVDSGKNGVQV